MTFYTSYYASKKLDRAKHLYVRTSVGSPRFCKCDEFFHVLAPYREWIGLAQDDYEPRYVAMLDGYGVEAIRSLMDALKQEAEAAGKVPVLLCFEALKTPGQFCHRRMFSEWYEAKTGEVIPEL